VITGAAGGIGAALAERLLVEGCRLALVDRDGDRLASLRASGVTTHVMDVADAGAWEALARAVEREHGRADLLINNAGVTVHGVFADQSLEDIDRIVGVNLKGVLYGCRAFLSRLARSGDGHIVNVSSLAGRVAFPYQSTYCATKFAVRGFSAALRMEMAPRGVGVTAVLPGTVATRLLEVAQSYDGATSRRLAELMLAYGARPDAVAERVVQAIRRNEAEALIGWDARITTAAQSISPSALYGALTLAMRARTRA
jgi:short-subunit dehydrogenase